MSLKECLKNLRIKRRLSESEGLKRRALRETNVHLEAVAIFLKDPKIRSFIERLWSAETQESTEAVARELDGFSLAQLIAIQTIQAERMKQEMENRSNTSE